MVIAIFQMGNGLAAYHTELLYEVAKTRWLLVHFLDKQIGEQTTDTLVHPAEGDVQSDVAKWQQRGGAA